MKYKYTIEEILRAVNDLQDLKKVKYPENLKKKKIKNGNLNIPKNTLKLIEEAEKNNN